jgi:O-antigen/teichoic acid export membrane protein
MGLIQRQGLKYSIVNWIGVFIGALSTLFVFPNALEEYGLMRFILDTSALLFPLLTFGINSITIRFFPYFEDKTAEHNGFLGFLLIWGGISLCIVLCVGLCFKDPIFAYYSVKSPLFKSYMWLIIPAMLFITMNNILYQYSVNFKRIVIPSLLLDVSQKIILPLLVIAYLYKWINLDWMLAFLIIYLGAVTIGFVWYIIHIKSWFTRINLQVFTPELRSKIKDYALFGLVGGLGALVISKLDTWLVSTFLSLRINGIYSISTFVANVMEVPARAVLGISIPLISKYWKDQNMLEIKNLYQKASLNLLILGLLLFGVFWVSVDVFFIIIANSQEMITGKYVILLLGIGRLIDMATGLNNYILNFSPYFKYSYIQIVIPALLSAILGVWLTPIFGMVGAATATLSAVFCYNAISVILNWHFFKMQPFDKNTGRVIIIAFIAFGIAFLIPFSLFHWLFAAIIRSGTFAILFLALIWKSKVSPDLNSTIDKFISTTLIKK